MKEQLEKIEALAKQELEACTEIKALDDLRIKFLGKKGELTAILKQMGRLTPEERPVIGQLANKVRADIEEALGSKLTALKSNAQSAKLKEETIDITLPGTHAPFGKLHPLKGGERDPRDIHWYGLQHRRRSRDRRRLPRIRGAQSPARPPCPRHSGYLLH